MFFFNKSSLTCAGSLYDVNNDGFITEDEMRLVVGAIYRLIDTTQADHISPDERGQHLFTVGGAAIVLRCKFGGAA